MRLSIAARSQLAEIIEYVGARSPSAARTIRDRVQAATGQLRRFPHLGAVASSGSVHPAIREILLRPYELRYVVLADEIVVMTIRHQRRLPEGDRD